MTMASTSSRKPASKPLRVKYPDDYNPILEYWREIENGLVVCEKIRKTYKKLVNDLGIQDGEFFYSPQRANHMLEFVENFCHHSKGKKFGGKPVRLELWEKALLAAVFGFIDADGNRKYREAVLIVAKKNGKSLIASCVGLYLQCADGEPGPEVYAVATKRDQAKIIWSEAKRMRNKSPALRKRVRALVAELVSDFNDGVFKPLASDVDTLDGLNVHGALMDEFHQWKNGRALFDIIADGVSAREQALILETSTAGTIREDFYDEKYAEAEKVINGYGVPDGYVADRFIAFVYELDKREEWTDPACWLKANPGLGTIKNLKNLQYKVGVAMKNRALVKNLLCKEFNIRETATESWLPFEACVNELLVCACDDGHWTTLRQSEIATAKCPTCGKPITTTIAEDALRGSYAVGGCDLSATTDLTCATLLIRKPGDNRFFVLQKYFLPAARVEEVEESSKREAPYELWSEQGWLQKCEGSRVDFHAVTMWFAKMVEKYDIRPLWIGYDRALAGYWLEEMTAYGFDMQQIAQGSFTFSYPMKRLGGLFEDHLIVYQNNPILRWCLTNTQAKSVNKAGVDSIQPEKPAGAHNRRIDGMVSLLNAFVCYSNHEDEYLRYVR